MTKQQHEIDVDRLKALEAELIDLVTESGNEELQEKFLEWMGRRNVCNQGFVDYLQEMASNENI
ncbi:MAG: hypothetical protein AAGH46_12405 [Bacteroidota bacterium]